MAWPRVVCCSVVQPITVLRSVLYKLDWYFCFCTTGTADQTGTPWTFPIHRSWADRFYTIWKIKLRKIPLIPLVQRLNLQTNSFRLQLFSYFPTKHRQNQQFLLPGGHNKRQGKTSGTTLLWGWIPACLWSPLPELPSCPQVSAEPAFHPPAVISKAAVAGGPLCPAGEVQPEKKLYHQPARRGNNWTSLRCSGQHGSQVLKAILKGNQLHKSNMRHV